MTIIYAGYNLTLSEDKKLISVDCPHFGFKVGADEAHELGTKLVQMAFEAKKQSAIDMLNKQIADVWAAESAKKYQQSDENKV